MSIKRKYPVGIQSFASIRKDGYLYVDKTPLVYKMITEGKTYFLSRPRRFGKSLLISTLQAVFEGHRDLFEAFTTDDGIEQPQLFIAHTDWKWEKHPVLRFDFSAGDLITIDQLDTLIAFTLSSYEKKYGITPKGFYVIEIKYDQSAEEALDQIDRKGYAGKYRPDGRPVTNVGISFSSEERNITEWKSIAK